jgi:hypothetical protein
MKDDMNPLIRTRENSFSISISRDILLFILKVDEFNKKERSVPWIVPIPIPALN